MTNEQSNSMNLCKNRIESDPPLNNHIIEDNILLFSLKTCYYDDPAAMVKSRSIKYPLKK